MKLKVKPEFELIGTIGNYWAGVDTFTEPWISVGSNLERVQKRLIKIGRNNNNPVFVIPTQIPKNMQVCVDNEGTITIQGQVKRYIYRTSDRSESIEWRNITITEFPEDRLYFEK